MIVRTMRFVTRFSMFTRIKFVVFWMIFLFFPSMATQAVIFIMASILIIIDEGSGSPIHTLLFAIVIELRFSSVVLPIMRVDTQISLMVNFVVRAPNGFKMKHVEINIFFKSVY